jgi:hypothetical protein
MLRYRLRTLLIVTALAALPLGRIAYLKRQSDLHHAVVADCIAEIVAIENSSHADVERDVRFLASGGAPIKTELVEPAKVMLLENASGGGLIVRIHATVPLYLRASDHQIIAEKYALAVYRPWTKVSLPAD